jgi:hypothetical protein
MTTGFCFPSSVALIAGIAGNNATLRVEGTGVGVGGTGVGVGEGAAVAVGVALGVAEATGVGLALAAADALDAGVGDAAGLIGASDTLEFEHPASSEKRKARLVKDRHSRATTVPPSC